MEIYFLLLRKERFFLMFSIRRFVNLLLKHKRLVNRNNIDKLLKYLRNGEILRGISRVYHKLECFDEASHIVHHPINSCLDGFHESEVTVEVDIIVPIYNAYEYTVKCIEAIYESTNSPYNLYLINDCSTDERIHCYLCNLKAKDKPEWLLNLVVIEHEENMGFVETVNQGIRCSKNHVVILNTDTEVPTGWLRRLLRPIVSSEKVASVTPFSNCAAICSFPVFCEDNALPDGISLADMDRLFSRYGGKELIEIPTGVGFCMAMNRDCIHAIGMLDSVYGRGYGEENDWCRRAVANGYTNVMVTNLFVYHKHGASFCEIVSQSKQERIEENLKILLKRYPNYQNIMDRYIAHDPAKDIRDFMWAVVFRHIHQKQSAELVINHSLGGGATAYVLRKIEAEKDKAFFLMELFEDGEILRLKGYNLGFAFEVVFNFEKIDKEFIKKLATCLHINHVFVNQLVGYPLEKITSMILSSDLPFTFFIHDFYCVCPRYNLLDDNYHYCKAEKRTEICNTCLNSCLLCKDIVEWRKQFLELFMSAGRVIAPSSNTANIINSYYPDVRIDVIEHELPNYIRKTYHDSFAENDILHISVLGAIGIEKGARIIEELVRLIAEQKLPIKITIIGYTDRYTNSYKSADGIFEITGRYDNQKVSYLLAKYQTNIVLVPSIWPETYSYTTSEAIYSGYKVLAFDLGAPAERIRKTGMGWLVGEMNANALLEKIVAIKRGDGMDCAIPSNEGYM